MYLIYESKLTHSQKQQPQQNEYQQHEAQQQQQQQHHQAPLQNQNYASATPLGSLQQGPTPVDCPSCGVRALTQTDYVSGGTTQYVDSIPPIPIITHSNLSHTLPICYPSASPHKSPMTKCVERNKKKETKLTIPSLAALLFCCVTCLGCIPYMAGWFKDVEHKCGNCGALLAVWHRSGRTEVVQHRVKPVQ